MFCFLVLQESSATFLFVNLLANPLSTISRINELKQSIKILFSIETEIEFPCHVFPSEHLHQMEIRLFPHHLADTHDRINLQTKGYYNIARRTPNQIQYT